MEALTSYRDLLESHLEQVISSQEPEQLYTPIKYILSLGGKRLRPVLTLMTSDFFGGKTEDAMNAALAVELFHNFSLIHDDIMDNAPLRRGKETVHEKWDLNTGILSGDAMLILAYRLFEGYPPETFRELAILFSQTALEVCEGQQYDVDFETRDDVMVTEYLKMIEYKTAVLVGASMKMGAIVAGASDACRERIYEFGRDLGIAFQLQDDYLDAFGDPETFGKQVGGDIIANKKTFLYLTALENASSEQGSDLKQFFSNHTSDTAAKVEAVKAIFLETGAADRSREAIEQYTQKAFEILDEIIMEDDKKEMLREFGTFLMRRTV